MHIVTMLTDNHLTASFMLHDVARSMRHMFDAQARALGVTRQQWRTLFYLSRQDGLSQTELADSLEVERISVCRMIDRLVENGLVERRADPQDRRVWRLHLLPTALPILEKLTALARELEDEMLCDLAPGRRKELFELLQILRERLKLLREDTECREKLA